MNTDLFSSNTPFTPPTTEGDRLSWLRLIRSRRVGPATFHRLIAEHGTARDALAALPEIARAAGIKDYDICPEGVARAEMAAAVRAGARMVCHGAPDYPPDLADLPDAPPLLWLRGDASALMQPMVAMVGARNASSLGGRMARRLAEALGAAGIIVVSGLARGIDAAAHEAALGTGTVAVLAGGVDVIYPTENADLAARIAAQGAIVSEQPPGLDPQARHFPMRNRIVSGMALGVIVVEAASRSGSLITAKNALDQGREVLAVPGHPVDARAAGCNQLIREGAVLIRDADDVIEALGPALIAARANRAHLAPHSPPPPAKSGPVRIGALTEAAQTALRRAVAIGSMLPGSARPGAARLRQDGGPGGPMTDGAAMGVGTGRGASVGPLRSEAPTRLRSDHRALHGEILARLGPSPLSEDQLIRDLAVPASQVAPELLALELDGQIERQAGGLLTRLS